MDIVNLINKYSSGDRNTLKIVEFILTKIKNEDYKYNSIDAAITTCSNEKNSLDISSISSILGLPHITVLIPINNQIPLGLSIIGKRNSDMAVIDLAKKIYEHCKSLN